MSCGMTPQIMEMMHKMQAEKEKSHHELSQAYEQTQNEIAIKRKIMENQMKEDPNMDSKDYDWTQTYNKWDKWEDPEELAAKEEEARRKLENARKATMCNHDHSTERELMDQSIEQKLTSCEEFRQFGNQYYREGQYQRASYYYHKALIYFEYMFPDTVEEEKQMDTLKVKILLNFAAARLKSNHLDDTINHCRLALQIEPNNIKALYRRAQAYRIRDNFEKAEEDLKQALNINPNDLAIRKENQLLQTAKFAYTLTSKELGKAMFSSHKEQQDKQMENNPINENAKDFLHSFTFDKVLKSTPQRSTVSLDLWKPCAIGDEEIDDMIKLMEKNEQEFEKTMFHNAEISTI